MQGNGTVEELTSALKKGVEKLSACQLSLSSLLAVVFGALAVVFLDVWLLGSIAGGVSSAYSGLFHSETAPGMSWYISRPGAALRAVVLGLLGAHETPAAQLMFRVWLSLNVLAALGAASVYWAARREKQAAGVLGSAEFTGLHSSKARKYLAMGYVPGILFGSAGVFGSPVVLKESAPGNRNVAVFGPPGTMKSAGYIRNNMFQAVLSGHSVVVTDPKGELARDFAPWFREQGYTVKIFNLVSPVNSDRWNPLNEVYDDFSAQLFSNIIISTTVVPGRKSGDEFWTNAELNLLKALVLYIVHNMPPANCNIGTLYRLISSGDIKSMTEMMKSLPQSHPAKMPYNLFADTTDNVKSGVVMGLGNRLSVFQNEVIDALTSVSDGTGIDIGLPGREKCAYFCILSDTDSAFDFIASLFFTFMFVVLVRQADRNPDGRLKVPVNFLLDEFCNISKIPDFTKKLSTMRGRGISCSIVFQSLPQLKSAYPQDGWQTILANCDYWLVLGANDIETASYVSRTIGATTVEVENMSYPKRVLPEFGGVKISMDKHKRDLLDPSEVLRFSRNECMVKLEDGSVVKLNKMHYSRHKSYGELKPQPLTEYTPQWSERFRQRAAVAEERRAAAAAPSRPTNARAVETGAEAAAKEAPKRAAPSPPAAGGCNSRDFFGGSFSPPQAAEAEETDRQQAS